MSVRSESHQFMGKYGCDLCGVKNVCALWSHNHWADLYQLQYLAKLMNWLLLWFGEGWPLISGILNERTTQCIIQSFILYQGFLMWGEGSWNDVIFQVPSKPSCDIRGGLYWCLGVSSLLLTLMEIFMVTSLTSGDEWLPLAFPWWAERKNCIPFLSLGQLFWLYPLWLRSWKVLD